MYIFQYKKRCHILYLIKTSSNLMSDTRYIKLEVLYLDTCRINQYGIVHNCSSNPSKTLGLFQEIIISLGNLMRDTRYIKLEFLYLDAC